MLRIVPSLFAILVATSSAMAQTVPSYSKQIRPFLTKYCLECHNAKTAKGTLSLDTYKALMDGADAGPVVVAGQPDKSKLVLLPEHKAKPPMPPAKAKFQPTKDEVALLRAWVAAGAKDDGVDIKVVLPAIKPKLDVLPPVTALAYLGKQMYFARKKTVSFIDFAEGATVKKELTMSTDVTAILAEGFFAAGGAVYSASDKAPIGKHSDDVLDLTGSEKGTERVASASYDSQIHVYSFPGDKIHVTKLKEHSDAVYGLAFNPDGTLLASVSADRAMKVFDVEKGKLLYTLGDATDWLYTVAWSPDGKYLVSGGVDKSIRVYEPTPTGAKLRQSVFAHEGAVQKVVFTSDSKTLYSVGQDRVVKAWDIEKMVERKVYDAQPETVMCLALREDAGQFIVGRYDGIVQLIDMKSGKVMHEFGKNNPKPKPRDERSDSRGSNPSVEEHATGVKEPIVHVLDRAGAVNTYRINVAKGQSLGLEFIKLAGSKLEPVLTIADPMGRIVAESYEGHLGHTFAEAGTHSFSVRDRDYRGGPDFKYRYKLGKIPIVTAVFPMGLQRGTSTEVKLEGVFLPKNAIKIDVSKDAKLGEVIPVPIGAGVLGKAQIVVCEFPDVSGGGKIPVPGTANGRLLEDNQKDLWSFQARKGQRLIVEVNARRLGSRLDSVIEILDQNDQPVPRAVLRSQAKTNVTFRDHDSASAGIRIETWSELATNDLLYVGNELVKIKELPTHPDADCNFFATDGKRLGYLDTTPTHHANNTPMYKVSLHPPGAKFPPNGFPVFTLYYKNDDGGPGYGRDSRIIFDPPADGEYKVRLADARGMGGVNFGYRLTVRHPRESFTLRATPMTPIVSKGGAIPITITAERIDGFDGPIKVQIKNLPPGFHVPTTTIEAGTYQTTVALYADANANPPSPPLSKGGKGGWPELILEGSTFATGLPFAFLGNIDAPKLIEPGDLVTTTAESEVTIKPGQQAKLLVRIERRNGFTSRVPLDVKGLPHGVRVLDIGLNGILVNESETTRTVVLYAEPWVQPAEHPFVVLARREGKNTEHAAKAVMLKVK